MENLRDIPREKLSGNKILRLMAISPENLPNNAEELQGKIGVDDLRREFVHGNRLSNGEVLLVNGEDILSRLPRPEEFGNRCLALMDLLDEIPGNTMFTLEIEEDDAQPVVAD